MGIDTIFFIWYTGKNRNRVPPNGTNKEKFIVSSTQAVDRISKIIDCVASNPNGCTLSEIVVKLNMPKTTTPLSLKSSKPN